jgi:hypothetical protein
LLLKHGKINQFSTFWSLGREEEREMEALLACYNLTPSHKLRDQPLSLSGIPKLVYDLDKLWKKGKPVQKWKTCVRGKFLFSGFVHGE